MKSLLVSTLAVGVAVAAESAYYIGNYTANGIVKLVPYPLGICVPTGAVQDYTYSIFTCDGDNVQQKIFGVTDTTCSGSSTTTTWAKGSTRGMEGYVNCEGSSSYMVLHQYLLNCNNWVAGKFGAAVTVIAADACIFSGSQGGANFYSRSTCDGDIHTAYVYAVDSTCSTTAAQTIPTTNECQFFTEEGGFKVNTALLKCVMNGEVQRCTNPLVEYEAQVTVEDAEEGIDYTQVYEGLFEYATVTTFMNDTSLHVALDFCSQFEDAKYDSAVKDLGNTTLKSPYVSDSARVCWTCVDYSCADDTLCGSDDYCVKSEQCTSAKSANAVYVSFTLMMALFLSLALF